MNPLKVFTVLKERNFALLWSGQLLSNVGDDVFRIAFIWLVISFTDSARAASVIFISYIVPNVVIALFAGAAVDRISRKKVMVGTDIVRGCLSLGLAVLLLTQTLDLRVLIIIYSLFGATEAFFSPAYMVMIREITSDAIRLQANAMVGIGRQTATIVGPLIGALIIDRIGVANAFIINTLTFAFSLVTLSLIRDVPSNKSRPDVLDAPPVAATRTQDAGFLRQIRQGLQFVRNVPWLWITIVVAGISNAAISGTLEVAIPFFVNDVLGNSASVLGLIFTMIGIGAVLGAFVAGQFDFESVRYKGVVAYSFLTLMGFCLTLIGSIHVTWFILLLTLIYGVSFQIFGVIWITTLQRYVPENVLGRVFSVDNVGSFILMPVGLALAGFTVSWLGAAPTISLGGSVVILGAVCGLLSSSVRRLGIEEQEVEDPLSKKNPTSN